MEQEQRYTSVADMLECTICLDPAVSPIHNCSNGHIVCGTCFESVKKCGLCQSELVPCFLAERLIKKYDVSLICYNGQYGCKQSIRCDQMQNHLQSCEYRPIQCYEKHNVACEGQLLPIEDFGKHLRDVHKTRSGIVLENKFEKGFRLPDNIIEAAKNDCEILSTVDDVKYIPTIFNYDGHDFVLQSEYRVGTLFWWIVVIGGKAEADQFTYNTTVREFDFKVGEHSSAVCTWKLPVLSFHENWTIKNTLKSGKFAHCHWRALTQLCNNSESNEIDDYDWTYEIQVEITRKIQM